MDRVWKDYKIPDAYYKGNTAIENFNSYLDDLSTSITTSSSELSNYDNSFKVGKEQSFKVISDDFVNMLGNKKKSVKDYLETSISAIQEIQGKMKKDEAAANLAKQAYNRIMDDPSPYEYYDDKGIKHTNTDKQGEDALAAGDATWDANKSDAW